MNNKIKLFLTVNYFLILSLNVLFSVDVAPDKVTQMQIKAIQKQLKDKTVLESQSKIKDASSPENLVKMDYKGGESDIETLDKQGLNYFGYSFFNSKSRAIANNQPPPPGYTLGPGDEVIIEIWGDTQMRSSHIIDLYGKIYVDKIGQVQLAELNLKSMLDRFVPVPTTTSNVPS